MAWTVLAHVVDLVAPPRCVVCGGQIAAREGLCGGCRGSLPLLAGPRCLRCGTPTQYAVDRCLECGGPPPAFEAAWSAAAYAGTARALVTAVKFRGARASAAAMAKLIVERAPPELAWGALVPVPATARAWRRRGFNPAELLAGAISGLTGESVSDCLRRTPRVRPQVGLERRDRARNAAGTVRARGAASAAKCAVLVDDVYTTGATLDACAQALREAGSQRITCVTFARTIRR